MLFVILLTTLFLVLFYNWYQTFTYWKRKGIDYVSLINCFNTASENILRSMESGDMLKSIYNDHEGKRYVGFYNYFQPVLLVRDPSLARLITKQYYDQFSQHSNFFPSNKDPIWELNLVNLENNGWIQIRKILGPIFSGNMRNLYPIVEKHAVKLSNYLKTKMAKGHDVFELKGILTRVSHDIMAPIAFGVNCDSLNEEDNELYVNCKKAFLMSSVTSLLGFLKCMCPLLTKIFTIKMYNNQAESFFINLYKRKIKHRAMDTVTENNIIDVLMNNKELDKIGEMGEVIVAQSVIFMFGALETISSVLTYACYHAAIDQNVQKQLYEEIQNTPNLSFENLNSLRYLDNFISETLRLHAPSAIIDRMCVKSCVIEPEYPNEKPLHIDEGTWVWILHRAMHYDNNYFPNPEIFDPDRFKQENKRTIKPGSYLPFGYGPKSCVAMQFGLIEIKYLLVHLLKNFEFMAIPKTNAVKEYGLSKIYPIKSHGIWLQLKARNSF